MAALPISHHLYGRCSNITTVVEIIFRLGGWPIFNKLAHKLSRDAVS